MKKGRRHQHPLKRLALAMGAAAAHIASPRDRANARRDAEIIPKCRAEIGGGRRGEMARLGRATLLSLPDLAPERFDEVAELLRGCRDAVMGRFELVNEVTLGDRRRRSAA